MTCAHVSVELAGPAYPRGTLACRQCGAIVPPSDMDISQGLRDSDESRSPPES